MRAYLIDPVTKTVSEVGYDGDYKTIYTLIGCDTFDIARIGDKGDGIYVDDNGLLGDLSKASFFKMAEHAQPLCGRGLVLGCDAEGDSIEPKITLAELQAQISFLSLAEVRAAFA